MHKTDKKLIIFDFDGTIANTWELAMSAANDFAQEHGLPEFVPEDHATLRDASLRTIAAHFGVSPLKIPFLFRKAQQELLRRADELQPIDGMPELLQKLHAQGYVLVILTTNIAQTVKLFLEKHHLTMFDSINTTQRGYRKAQAIKRILKKHKCTPQHAVHVGDTKNDVRVSHRVHVPAVAVTWGLNSQSSLEKENPLYIAETAEDLYTILTRLLED